MRHKRAQRKSFGRFSVRALFLFFLAFFPYANLSAAQVVYFNITGPTTIQADTPFYVTVTAITTGGATVTDYAGTVTFDTSSVLSSLPADYTFQTADLGTHVFQAQIMSAGDQTLSVYDADSPWLTGNTVITITGGAAQTFAISAPSTANAGQVFYMTVSAKDSYNNVAVAYSGTASFSSTDAVASLPPDMTFQRDNNGVMALAVTMKTKGTQVINVQDLINTSINGSSNAIDVRSGIVSRFAVDAPTAANPGTSFNYAVTAMDAYGNIVDWYSGTAHFTSTDGAAALPANYAFQASDYGSRIFSATLNTAGTQTLSVNDAAAATITGVSGSISVNAVYNQYSQPLLLTSYLPNASMYQFVYVKISAPANTAVPANAYLEYDVFMPSYNADFYTGTEFAGSWTGGQMRDFGAATHSYIIDQNGIRCHPSMDLSAYAAGQWYHRKFDISALSGTYNQGELAQDTGNAGANGAPSNNAGTFNAIYDNIRFSDSSGTTLRDFFANRSTIPYLNGVVVDGNVAANRGNGGISLAPNQPQNNYVYIVKDMTLSANPAGGVVADGAHAITVTAFLFAPDASGIGYALADFASDRPQDTVAPVAVSQNTKAITDPAGNAKAYITSTKAGSADITVRCAHMSKIITVNFVAGPAAKADIIPPSLSIQRTIGLSKSTGTMLVRVEDAFGNFAAYAGTINLTSNSPTMQFSTDNGATWQAAPSLSALAENSVLVTDTNANTATVQAAVAGLSGSSCTVYVNDAAGTSLAMIPGAATFKAGAVSTLTVQAKDSAGNNTFANDSVQLSSASSTMMFSQDGINYSQSLAADLSNGRLDVYYYDTVVAANVTLTVQAAGYASGKAYMTTITGDPAVLNASSNKYAVIAGGSVTITAQITDAYGNPVADKFITFTAQVENGNENAVIVPAGNSTNAQGQVTVVFWTKSGSAAENYAIINSTGLLGKTLTISGASPAGAAKYNFLPDPLGVGADNAGTLFVNAKDAGGYNSPAPSGHTSVYVYVTFPAGSTNVNFSINGGINWYNSVTATLDTSGSAQVLVKSHFPGTYNFWGADINPVTPLLPAFSTFTVSTSYFVSVTPNTQVTATAGAYVTITAQMVDQNGAAAALQGVRATFSSNHGSVSPVVVYTDASGKASTLLALSIAPYTQHLVNVNTSSPDGNTVTGVITSMPVITFDVSLQSTATKGAPVQVVVRARDAYGVTIPNYTGTVHFTSTDPLAVLPADYTFTTGNGGIKAFSVNFGTASPPPFTVTVKDTLNALITGSSNSILIYNAATPTATFTPTKTITPTWTNSPTITKTYTVTPTYTVTQTATPTDTQTYTPTFTATSTFTITRTSTITPTFTMTPTITPTWSITQTWTISKTWTVSPTFTATASITQTWTDSPTYTVTLTCTDTPTITETCTVTPTYTVTLTDTPTYTVTVTLTGTPTCTNTPTSTPSPTATKTSSFTATYTATKTATLSATPTRTPTVTMTGTATITSTRTATGTVTPTYTITQTQTITQTWTITRTWTYSPTFTITPSITQTLTDSPTFTVTETDTVTPTVTETHTNSPTYTVTLTGTPSYTATITLTETMTYTLTYTYTVTDTGTQTNTPTITATLTITPTAAYVKAGAGESYVCPQPASTVLYVMYGLYEDAQVKIYIYNTAGMQVADFSVSGIASGTNMATIDLSKFSTGIYYYIMKARSPSGRVADFKVNKFMVAK
jgi:hypothetical protein